MKRIISILLENESGALSRVVGLFAQRGYNIDTLTVAPTDDDTLSRLTLTTQGDDQMAEQIVKQLHITRSLSIVVAFIHPAHDSRAVSVAFVKTLQSDGWLITDTSVSFQDYGDSISGSSLLNYLETGAYKLA